MIDEKKEFEVRKLVDQRQRILKKLGASGEVLARELQFTERTIGFMGYEILDSPGGTTWREKE